MKSTSRDRALGYWQALGEFGTERENVPVHGTRSDKSSVDTALNALFATLEPPTAILAMSDRIALFTMQWLAERGFDVPGESL